MLAHNGGATKKGRLHHVPSLLPLAFTDGILPPGDYEATLIQLAQSMLVNGPQPALPGWDVDWRRYLVGQLALLASQLWQEGVQDIYVDGSFVEDKLHPGDIDGYYVCTQQDIANGLLRRLNARNAVPIWIMSNRLPDPTDPMRMKPLMWHRHKVELFAEYGQFAGIVDQFGHNQTFPAAFRKTRARRGWRPKGIVHLIR